MQKTGIWFFLFFEFEFDVQFFFSRDYQIDSENIRTPNIYRLFIKRYLRFSRGKPHSKKKKTITCEWKSSLATAEGYLY